MKLLKKVAAKAAKVVKKSQGNRQDGAPLGFDAGHRLSESELQAVLAESELQAVLAESEIMSQAQAMRRAAMEQASWQQGNFGAQNSRWGTEQRSNSYPAMDELDTEELELSLALEASLAQERARKAQSLGDPLSQYAQQQSNVDIWSRASMGHSAHEDLMPILSSGPVAKMISEGASESAARFREQRPRERGTFHHHSEKIRLPAVVMQPIVLPTPVIAEDIRMSIFKRERSLNASLPSIYDLRTVHESYRHGQQSGLTEIGPNETRGERKNGLAPHLSNQHVASEERSNRRTLQNSDGVLSEGWEGFWSKTYQKHYYYNKIKNEYTWQMPLKVVLPSSSESFPSDYIPVVEENSQPVPDFQDEGWDYSVDHPILPSKIANDDQSDALKARPWALALVNGSDHPPRLHIIEDGHEGWDYTGSASDLPTSTLRSTEHSVGGDAGQDSGSTGGRRYFETGTVETKPDSHENSSAPDNAPDDEGWA